MQTIANRAVGNQAFSSTAQPLWNALTMNNFMAETLIQFRRLLKTYMFFNKNHKNTKCLKTLGLGYDITMFYFIFIYDISITQVICLLHVFTIFKSDFKAL